MKNRRDLVRIAFVKPVQIELHRCVDRHLLVRWKNRSFRTPAKTRHYSPKISCRRCSSSLE
jgi:hypothetical protein